MRSDAPRYVLPLVCAILIAHAVLAWLARPPGMAWWEDDAQYLILSGELLNGSYRNPWLLGNPVEVRYPPGFPALLALGRLVLGTGYDRLVLIVIACSVTALILMFDAVRRHLGLHAALFVLGLSAISPALVLDAGVLMSELPFTMLVALTIWAASVPANGPDRAVLAGFAAVAAATTRTAGIAVLGALGLYWLYRRQWKRVAWLAVGSMPVVAWVSWSLLAPEAPGQELYGSDLASAVSGREVADRAASGLPLPMGAVWRLWIYSYSSLPSALGFVGLGSSLLDNALWALLFLLTVPLGLWLLVRRWIVLPIVATCYLALLLVWPHVVTRFLDPLVGVAFAVMAAGVVAITQRANRPKQALPLVLIAIPFVAGSSVTVGRQVAAMVACDRTAPTLSATCFRDDARGYLQLASFARSLPESTLFYATKPGGFFLHSGHRTVAEGRYGLVPPDSIAAFLQRDGVEYAVVTPIGGPTARRNRQLARACRNFDLVREFDGETVLLRLRSGAADAEDSPACRTLSKWRDGVPTQWLEPYGLSPEALGP